VSQTCPNCGRANRDTSKFCAFCRTALNGLLPAGTVLQNRYQINSLLGAGGMGAVYLAQDQRLGPKSVALKENFDASLHAQQQFQFEAHILANLDHPNLPKVTDHFIEPSGRQYLVMEYVEGQDLDSLGKQRGPLPEKQVQAWAATLLDALHYLHSRPNPVIHRDIKPSNIKLTPQGVIKLVDFGIAKVHRPGQVTQTAARQAGSPGFAPLEQYGGGTDARSDIYSLGATLYWLLTGQTPPDAVELAGGRPLPPPRQLRPDLSPATQSLIFRAMALQADQRFQSAAEMRAALHAGPAVVPPTQTAAAPPGRRPTIPFGARLAAVGLVVLAALVLISYAVLRQVGAATPTPVAGAVATASTTPTSLPTPANTAEAATATSQAATHTAAPTSTPTTTPPPGSTATATSPPPSPSPAVPTPTLPPDSLTGLTVSTTGSAQSGIRVELRYADGTPKTSSWVGIYEQETDVSGNPVAGREITNGRTNDTGAIFFDLDPGTYAVGLGDLSGYIWGYEFNYTVQASQATILSLTLGQLAIGVRNASGQPLEGRWTAVFLQTPDISGNPIKGERINYIRTDNTGRAIYNLTSGLYAVEIGDIAGEQWGNEINHAILPGQQTTILLTLGRITVGVKNADDQPVAGRWVAIYFQEDDVSGNPIKGERIVNGRTDNAGLVSWDLTAGTYAVEIGDLLGALWGSEVNHAVQSGETTTVVLTLGRLRVGLRDSEGNAIVNRWVGLFHQEQDVTGNPVKGESITSGRTDATGLVAWDLTAGTYMIEVENIGPLYNVVIQAGETTFSDGTSSRIE
jgi:serine/threonine protein kinase